MELELTKTEHDQAIASIKLFAREELEAELTDLKARQLLDFMVREVCPLAYNKGVRDAEGQFRRHLEDLSASVYAPPFTYWNKRRK